MRFARPLLVLLTIIPSMAGAQTYSVNMIAPQVQFGTIASATTGDTVFNVSVSTSARSVVSGSGGLIGAGLGSRAAIYITCVDGSGGAATQCSNTGNKAMIKIAASGTPTGRAKTVTGFVVINGISGTPGTVASQVTNGDGSYQFVLSGWTASNQTRDFVLSTNFTLGGNDGGGSTGSAVANYSVGAAKNPTVPTPSFSGTVSATVRRSLAVTKNSDLAFGSMLVPSGSGSVIISTAGARSTSGVAPTLITGPAFSAASYTITGESGTTFSITVPASFTITNGTTTLTVTTTASASGTQTLTGGTFALTVGGSLPVTASSTRGNYTGSFSITLTYN